MNLENLTEETKKPFPIEEMGDGASEMRKQGRGVRNERY